ncbi:hypothetical protein CYMTET_10185 [Cymbomonas tetramitiformis]|uniref:Uncharacterized protein n=1 Tax=Cymbomonas tetramitiformis TaxID=36881 RepID=A0AAE0GQ07_9CHLO|nr:hypothetical protein CYMTET_10185 [Cymbomonas tetramitiformis]
MMYWNPHTGSGSPALIAVQEDQDDPTSTNPEAFVWAAIGQGRYRFACFGHQHLLEAKRRCVKADEAKHANHENRTEAFQFIKCRLFMNLSAIEMNQLGNEQNNIDAYMKHRNITEIILGMRKHVEKLMADPSERDVAMKRHLTEKLMDRSLCRKLSKRWHGPVAVTECFYSDLQAEMPERTVAPEAVVVDGQKEAHVERILSRRVRVSRGKEIEEWKERWTGFSKARDQWRTRDKLKRGRYVADGIGQRNNDAAIISTILGYV